MFGKKYKNKKTSRGGRSFASKGEAGLYDYLFIKEKAREIFNLKCQVQVYLTEANILYKPDFSYESDGQVIYCEYKGFETAIWRIKRRLWEHYGPGKLEVYKGLGLRMFLVETIIPK